MFIVLLAVFFIQNLESSSLLNEDDKSNATFILDTAVRMADGEIPVGDVPGVTMSGDEYIKSFTYLNPNSHSISYIKITQTQFYINDMLAIIKRISMPIAESQLQYFLDLRCQIIASSYQRQKFMDGVKRIYRENNLTDSAD
jgi:hypothetical protein